MGGVANRSPRAIEAIYEAASAPDRWPDTLAQVADHIGTSGGLIAFHPKQPQPPFTVIGRLREDLTELYLRDYVANPLAIALQRVPPGVPILTDTLVDKAVLRRSAFHADILAPQGIDTQVAFTHPSLCWPGGSGGFAFTLTARQSEDRFRITHKLRPLVPHLIRAVDLSLSVGRRLARNVPLELALDAMPMPAMLLDGEGRLDFANVAAEALLRGGDGLSIARAGAARLAASIDGEQRHLSNAVQTSLLLARGRETDWAGTVRLTRPSGRQSLTILVTPLPEAFHPFGAAMPSRGRVLVQVLGSARGGPHQAGMLRRLFALTPAEARTAALIGSGLSVPSAAAVLGISVTTVKTHLNRCFDKVEVRSQAELAHLVAQLPGPAHRLAQAR